MRFSLRSPRTLVVLGTSAVVAALILGVMLRPATPDGYRTATVDRGEIVRRISANGTLNPVTLVSVGTQVSGTVYRLHADFNDRVKRGQILAELDPALFRAQEAQDQANLASAQSNLTLALSKATRSRQLYAEKFISSTELEQTEQALEAARAQVALAQAQLERSRTNLRYAVIRSPISGVVVARNVSLGQTVAASFQTPTLFQIAEDLRRMQIETSVAEADVGAIQVGQPVAFTVDAFPEREFAGRVSQIRLNPTVQQNVVTYNVVVAVDNPEGVFLPGMTAHVYILIARRDDVLRVPNAALRFKPEEAAKKQVKGPVVYRVEGERLVPVSVGTGISDTSFTEVLSGELEPGDALAIGKAAPEARKNERSGFRLRTY